MDHPVRRVNAAARVALALFTTLAAIGCSADPFDGDVSDDDDGAGHGIDGDESELVAEDEPVDTNASALTKIASPVAGRPVTYAYGVKNARYAAGYHTGQDHAAPTGTPVVAVRAGTIRWSNDAGGAYGKWIGLDADNGRTYVYCHLSARTAQVGAKVTAGQALGKVGATGNVTGPHLHFEDHPLGPFKYGRGRKPAW